MAFSCSLSPLLSIPDWWGQRRWEHGDDPKSESAASAFLALCWCPVVSYRFFRHLVVRGGNSPHARGISVMMIYIFCCLPGAKGYNDRYGTRSGRLMMILITSLAVLHPLPQDQAIQEKDKPCHLHKEGSTQKYPGHLDRSEHDRKLIGQIGKRTDLFGLQIMPHFHKIPQNVFNYSLTKHCLCSIQGQ